MNDEGVIWITGAGSGLGEALALNIAANGAARVTLVLSGRRRTQLEGVGQRCAALGATVQILPVDLADPDSRKAALVELQRQGIRPETLINNAGVSQRAPAEETSCDVDRRLMEVNYLAAVELTKAVLPGMIAAGRGRICAVSSVAALIPVPQRSGYNAAKAAQWAFFRTLANELSGRGIQVTTAIPGFVRTDISRNAHTGDGKAWGGMDRNQAGGISPEQAAGEILRGMRRGRTVVYTGLDLRLRTSLLLHRLAPALLDRILRNAEVT